MRPPWSILDRSRKYVPSYETNVAATFARVRQEREREAALAKAGIVSLPQPKARAK